MSFVPPSFKKLGSACSDLLSKEYGLKQDIKFISKSGPTSLDVCVSDAGSAMGGKVTLKHKDSNFGEAEIILSSSSKASASSAKATFNKFYKGADATVNCNGAMDGDLEVNYSQDSINTNAKLTKKGLNASAVFGMDGISLGVAASTDADFAVTDYNVGAQYSKGGKDGYTFAVKTTNKLENVSVSVFQKYKPCFSWGATMTLLPTANHLTVGTQYALDKNTTLKLKSDTDGQAALGIQRRTDDFLVKVSSDYDISKGNLDAAKFGFALEFGDF